MTVGESMKQNRNSLRVGIAVGTALLSLASFAGTVLTSAPTAQAAPKKKPPANKKQTNIAPAKIAWGSCSEGAAGVECADFIVPINAAEPALGTTRLAIARRKALAKPRLGVLFVNPGGPGGSAVQLVNTFHRILKSGIEGGNTDQFDLIGFDPRGVGASQRIQCSSKLSDLGLNPFTTAKTPEERAELSARWSKSCSDKTGPLFGNAGTIDAADDMDRLRAALGEPQISYLGFSYGTVLGSVYAARYGSRVRAMVLDAAVDPTTYGSTYLLNRAASVESRLRDFSNACAGSSGCALSSAGSTPDSIAKQITDVFTKIETGTAGAADRSDQVQFTRSYLVSVLEEQATWPEAASIIKRLNSPTGANLIDLIPPSKPLLELSDDPEFWTVECTDAAYPNTADELSTFRNGVPGIAPVLGPVWTSRDGVCVNWPTAKKPLGSLVSTATRAALVIGGTKDSRTPLIWSSGLAKAMGNARLLTRDGDGHTSFDRSRCVREAVGRYLTTFALPDDGTICPSRN
jgi:pimeloyl-ACP methyl ester carboxylesterase